MSKLAEQDIFVEFSAIGSRGSTGIFAWMHHTERGSFVIGARYTRRPVVSLPFARKNGISVMCSAPPPPEWTTGRVGTESGDQDRGTLSALHRSDESLDGSCLRERDSQCRNTLGGSDTKHPAASSSWRLLRTTTEYLEEKWQQKRPIFMRDGFIIHSWSFPWKAETPPRTRWTKTWHKTLHEKYNVRPMA